MPRRRRRIPGPRALAVLVLLALLFVTLSWLFGRRPAEPGGGPDPVAVKEASLGGGPAVQVLRPVVAPREGSGATGAVARVERAVEPDPLEGRSWLHGRVVDANGRPLAARVVVERALSETAFPALPPAGLGDTSTDENGSWTVGFAPPDDVVRVVAWVRGVPHVAATFERVPPWTVVDAGELRETPPRRFRIREPAFGVLRPVTATAFGAAPVLVDERTLVPPGVRAPEEIDVTVGAGDWELVVLRENALPVRLALRGEPELPAAVVAGRRPITVGGERAAWVLHTTGDGAVTSFAVGDDRVVGVPAAGNVRVLFAGCEPVDVPPGAVEVDPPPRGEVLLAAEAASRSVRFEPAETAPALRASLSVSHDPATGSFLLRAGRYRAFAGALASAAFDVEAGGRATVSFDAAPGRRLTGRVEESASGRPCAGAAVVVGRGLDALARESLAPTALTDENGRFEIGGLPAGELDVVVTSPRHRVMRRRVTMGEDSAATAAVSVALAAGPAVEVRITEGGMDVAAVDRRGTVVRATGDANGVARLGALTPGRWVVFVVPGRLAVPLDGWDWLVSASGGRVVDVGDAPVTLDWRLPPAREWHGDIVLENAPTERIALRIVHADEAPAPGVWPDLVFEDVAAGPVRIDRLFPGRYRAIATAGERSEVVDLELPAEGPGPGALVFVFPRED